MNPDSTRAPFRGFISALAVIVSLVPLSARTVTAQTNVFLEGFETGTTCPWSAMVGGVAADPRTDHLLISEFATAPIAGEFVEIYNPTASVIDLSNYYLYDATSSSGGCFYYNEVSGTQCGSSSSDFALRFPVGAAIFPSQRQVVALTGAPNYCGHYFPGGGCSKPEYEIPAPPDDPAVPNMSGVYDSSGVTTGFLAAASEDLVLFRWNGLASTVTDVDYVVWGTDLDVRTDKSGVSGYPPDTAVASQRPLAGGLAAGLSYQRVCEREVSEVQSGTGNGITGHDETSENLAAFGFGTPTPKS